MALRFVDGIRVFSRAFARTWLEPELRSWYFRTLAITFVFAIALIVVIFLSGSWAFTHYFEKPLATTLAILAWFLMLLYLSGRLASLLMSVLVLLIGGESSLTRHYFKKLTTPPSEELRAGIRLKFSDRSRELLAMLRSLGISLLAWPLLLLPITMPLGVLIFSWALAGESLALSRRLCHERGYEALQDREELSLGAQMGLAVLPSSMALFPVLGWVLLPILQVAGLEMQLAREIRAARSSS